MNTIGLMVGFFLEEVRTINLMSTTVRIFF